MLQGKSYRVIILISFLFFFLSCIHPISILAQELPIATAEYPPFKYTDPGTKKIIGYDTEIVTETFKLMGITPNIKMMPYKRADWETRQGKHAAYYTFTITPDRLKDYYISDPISTLVDVLFKLKSANITWNTYKDLAQLRLGYTEGYNWDKEFLAAFARKQAVSGTDLQLLMMLAGGRFDIMPLTLSVGSHLIRQHPDMLGNIDYVKGKSIPHALSTWDTEGNPLRLKHGIYTFHVGFSKKWPGAKKLRDNFNVALKKFAAQPDKPRKRIIEKYGGTCHGSAIPDCK